MAGFHTKTFTKHDDYMTPDYAWQNIKKYIPKDKVLWEAFYGDGTSGTILNKMGFNTIHEDIDFFENNKGDVIVSNPPFTKIPEVLERIKELNKPFIMIMPSSKINTQYFRKTFEGSDSPIQLIIPRKRIQFLKMVNGVVDPKQKKACNFDCFYYCWKMNLDRDIIWLTDDECVEMKKTKKKKKLKIKKKVVVQKNKKINVMIKFPNGTLKPKRLRRKKKEINEAREMMKNDYPADNVINGKIQLITMSSGLH